MELNVIMSGLKTLHRSRYRALTSCKITPTFFRMTKTILNEFKRLHFDKKFSLSFVKKIILISTRETYSKFKPNICSTPNNTIFTKNNIACISKPSDN